MAERKLVYRNDGAVKRTMIWEDDDPLTIHVLTELDMTQTIENNKVMRELHPRRSANKLLARGVPMTVAEQSLRECWDDNDWKKWLNDPDNAAFRVWRGRV
jgi:hypothetical protein